MGGGRRFRARTALAVGLAVGAASIGGYAGDVLRPLELETVDARFAARGAKPPDDIVVVAVDDVTFDELRRRWPFPRSLHAAVVSRLREAGARTIAYDVQFTEPTSPEQDLRLFEAVARAGGVVLATSEVDERGRTNVLGGEENLHEAGARAASTVVPSDPGGVLRRVPSAVDGLPTFARAIADGALGRPSWPRAVRESQWIDYHGPPGTVPTISFSRVLRGRDRELLRDKIVVVGASAPTLQDLHPTAAADEELMSGPEVQANAASTVLRGFPLRGVPLALGASLILATALLAPVASLRVSMGRVLTLAVAAAAILVGGAHVAFLYGSIVPLVYPLTALALGTITTVGLRYSAERRERRLTRTMFSRFVPEAVVNELLDRDDVEPRLGGRRLVATVMFCDLRGFTRFAEGASAERVIEVLNRYLTEMSAAILDHGGTVVSYMGDGIMAVFGSPIERSDHAEAAFAAARDMLDQRLVAFNRWLEEQRVAQGFQMGIGLSTGPVLSGNVGSERRLEYAAVGDTTNVAARLEAMTKDVPFALLIAESTRALIDDDADLVDLGPQDLGGRRLPVRVWALPGGGSSSLGLPADTAPLATAGGLTPR